MDDFYTTGLEPLELTDETHKGYIPPEEIDEIDYSRGIPIARKKSGGLLRIKFDEETRVGIFSPSGNGKTVLGKRMISTAYTEGYKIFHGSDIKNDFQKLDSYGGASKKLIEETEGLLPGEESIEIPRTLAIPSFMVKKYSSPPDSYATRFAVSFSDITMQDFRTLVRYDTFTDVQKDVFDNVMNKIDINQTNWNELLDKFEKEAVLRRLRALKKGGLIKSSIRSGVDVLQDLNEKGCVALGLKNYRKFNLEKLRFYSGVLHRNFKDMIEDGAIQGPFILYNDEFHKLAPDGVSSPVKDEFQDLLDVTGRQTQMSTIISAQRPSQIPWTYSDDSFDFLGTLNHIFLGFNLPGSDWKKVIKSTPLWDQHHSDKWQDKMRRMDKYDFLYINVNKHTRPADCPIVRSLSPLVHHPVKENKLI